MPRSQALATGVPDPTDPQGTCCPDKDPVPEVPNAKFTPLETPPFAAQQRLPPGTNTLDAYAIWSLFFTKDILQDIVDLTNQEGDNWKARQQGDSHANRTWEPITINYLYT